MQAEAVTDFVMTMHSSMIAQGGLLQEVTSSAHERWLEKLTACMPCCDPCVKYHLAKALCLINELIASIVSGAWVAL